MEQIVPGRDLTVTILFAGGDLRTLAAVDYIQKQGHEIITYAIPGRTPPQAVRAETLILPYPVLRNGRLNAPLCADPPTWEEFLQETGVSPDLPAIGGPAPDFFSDYTDLSQREDLKLRNAVTTAEGALDLLIRNTEEAIFGLPCLIVGFGAIGKRLSRVLSALGASVTVAARKGRDRTDAELQGYGAMDTEALDLQGFSAVINTAPALLLTGSILNTASKNTLFLELASAPGGIDREAAELLDLRIVDGPALPGRVAPRTAGIDLAKTVLTILQEKGSGIPLGT